MANNDLDPEEVGQEQGSSQKEPRRGGNIGYNAANDLNNFAGKATKVGNKLGEKAAKKAQFAQANTGTKAVKAGKQAQKLQKASEKALKMAAKAQKFAKVAAFLGKVIAIAGLIILVLMIVIGIIVFLIAGWGMILSGFKEIGRKFWDVCKDTIFGAERNVKDDQIINLIDNIETMGYDLYGYGFVSSTNEDEKYHENGELIQSLEDKNAYRYLTSYLISDNYAYYIKNHNFNFRAIALDAAHYFGGIFDSTNWGSGLISIYEQAGEDDEITGIRGEVYGTLGEKIAHGLSLRILSKNALPGFGGAPILKGILDGIRDAITNWDQITSKIEVNRSGRTLDITAIGFLHDEVFHYSLDRLDRSLFNAIRVFIIHACCNNGTRFEL